MLHRMTPSRDLPGIKGWNIVRGGSNLPPDSCLRVVWADDSSTLSIVTGQGSREAPTFVIRYDEVAQFTLSFGLRQILISPFDDDVLDNTIEHLLVDQIWPRILAHRGELVLHAAGVSGPSGAILFVGQSGRGKSTLAGSLHQRGFELLGDDAIVVSAVDDITRCSAVYRSLRLFPDSIESLFDQPVHRSEVAEYTDKENVHLPAPEGGDSDHRVRAIFFIGEDKANAIPSLELVSPGDACMRLVEHSFWLDPTNMALTTRKLASASALANRVPVYQLSYMRDYARLDELHAVIFSVLD